MLFLNWEERRRHRGKRQDILSRKQEILRELNSEQVLFQEKEEKNQRGVWDKSRYCDKVPMRKDLWEKDGMPVSLGS